MTQTLGATPVPAPAFTAMATRGARWPEAPPTETHATVTVFAGLCGNHRDLPELRP